MPRDPEKRKVSNRLASKRYMRKLRKRAIDFLGGCCSACGINDIRVLDIDHVFGGGSKETPHDAYRRVLKAPSDFRLLCANCHRIRHFNKEFASYGG